MRDVRLFSLNGPHFSICHFQKSKIPTFSIPNIPPPLTKFRSAQYYRIPFFSPYLSSPHIHVSTMSLLDFPTEILEIIGHSLESEADINALLQTNRRFHQILKTYLYKFNASFFTGSALLWAVRHGQPQTAHCALQNGVEELLDWDREPLHCAAENGDKDMVLLLLQYGAGVDCRKQDKTPLYVAAAKGHQDVVELLLQNGAYLESNNFQTNEDPHGASYNTRYNTPLHIAAYNGHVEVVKLLLQKGANVEAENTNLITPLKQALIDEPRYDIFWLLMDRAISEQGRIDPEMIRFESDFGNHIEVVRGLLERGLDPNSRDEEGNTILTDAALYENSEAVRLLVERGAGLRATNNDGHTALGTCASFGRETSVKILLDCGADPNSRDLHGNTALHLARNAAIAQLLLSRGAIVDMNDNGETPLSKAVEMGYDDVKQLLLQYSLQRPSSLAVYDMACLLEE